MWLVAKKVLCLGDVLVWFRPSEPNLQMSFYKRIFLVGFGVLVAGMSFGQTLPQTSTNTFTVNQAIPHGSTSGLQNTQTLDFTGQQLYAIVDISVTLDIAGGFNGDYYAYLVHDNGFAVLLNRPGVTTSNPVGYADSGMNVTLSDSALTDIHYYQTASNPNGGLLTGLFADDGRNVDPETVNGTEARTALLGSFVGEDPSGQWTLFLSDLDYGEQGQLVSWGLVVTAVPEPGTCGLLALGLAGMLGLRACKRGRK